MAQKKAYILAFHRALNYGAVLQIYALSKTIEKLGIHVEVIDYIPEWMKISLKNQPSIMSYCKRCFMKVFFRNFQNKLVKTKKQFTSVKQLKEKLDHADFYITGSDQVWNEVLTKKDDAYFLSFAPEEAKKIGYAVSMGNKPISPDFTERVQELVLKFNAISVREKYVSDFIKSFKNDDSHIPIVLDPSLLLDEDDYIPVCSNKVYKQPYIAVYPCMHDEHLYKLARYLRDKAGIPLINLGYHFKGPDKHEYLLGPDNFINRIKNAEYVITNSFHGTAFSVLHKKKFMIVPNQDENHKGLNARFVELLFSLNLSRRLVLTESEIDIQMIEPIDYKLAFELLKNRRDVSMAYLKNALNFYQ